MKQIIIFTSCLFIFFTSFAQQEPETNSSEKQHAQNIENASKLFQHFKISGYIQGQYQYGEEGASLKVGTPNENPEKSFSRIGIRRGRIKLMYEEKIVSGVFQLDITEKGVGVKEAYLTIKDPWIGTNALRAGIFDRPFGNEISYSSSRRESPERSTVFQTLFPDARDVGASLTLQAAKTSPWNCLKLDAGLFAGNGIKQETDSRRDFIGHLSVDKNFGSNIKLGGGVSYYNGSVYQGNDSVYTMEGNAFALNDNTGNKGGFAKRAYIGFDLEFSIRSVFGLTQLRTEYLFGEQPGAKQNSKSPNASTLPSNDTYIRNFSGGYIIFVQSLGKLPFSAVVKYDWYDPNTKVSGNEIGLNNVSIGDIAVNTFGFGLLWQANDQIRLQAFYEINKNETTENISTYQNDRQDNVFTLRLQYKF